MKTLAIKIPPQPEQEIVLARERERERFSKSGLVRRALVACISQRNAAVPTLSALAQAGDLVNCCSGGPSDPSSNPRHLDDFGRV